MAHLIDKDAVLAIIEMELSYYKNLEDKEIISDCGIACYRVLRMLKSDIESLEVKEVYVSNPQFPHLKDVIDKVFGAGNLEFWEYDDAEQLVLLAKDEVISQACEAAGMKKPYKDGNQWCILKGENIQEGICGFGENIEDALVAFLKDVPNVRKRFKEQKREKV